MKQEIDIAACFRSRHEAMDTEFSLWLPAAWAEEGLGMARLCWEKIDDLEQKLSRFVEASDVSRMNRMRVGEVLYVAGDTHRCLLAALRGYEQTAGLFDITMGHRMERVKQGLVDEAGDAGQGGWVIDPDRPMVTCVGEGRRVDLGGIGKGFAVEVAKEWLQEWGVDSGMLAAGASTIVAFGKEIWPVELTGRREQRRMGLCGQALSASGMDFQGRHILHPDGDLGMPELPMERVWVLADDGVAAEVASTAMMLVAADELGLLLSRVPGVRQAWYEGEHGLQAVW